MKNPVIEKVEIEKFRALKNLSINFAPRITAIAGKNGTLKTTLLGIIGQPFTISKDSSMYGISTIDGYKFKSQFREKFKLSKEKDLPGEHKWSMYLNKQIYDKDDSIFKVISIQRDKKSGEIRFWNAKGKEKSTGYPQCPVIYLSLKRLNPIGEENKLETISTALNDDEKILYKNWYNDIFTITDNNIDDICINDIKSINKYSVALTPKYIDPLTISAGQDNIGKILISLLSFRRLKNTYPTEYKGGLLLIDELESTLHSSALKRLLRILIKSCGDFNIQIILTTHSEDVVIKELLSTQYNKENKVLYLKKVGDTIRIFENSNLEEIKSDLGSELLHKTIDNKILVHTEDKVAQLILKKLLPNTISKTLTFSDLSIGHGEYKNLLDSKYSDFLKSIIVIDGDQYNNTNILKYKNILTLPGNYAPEEFLYKYLKSLKDDDNFWNNTPGQYDKEKCFINYPNAKSTEQYKKWFLEQKENFGRGLSKVMNKWKLDNEDTYITFLKNFETSYEYINKKYNII